MCKRKHQISYGVLRALRRARGGLYTPARSAYVRARSKERGTRNHVRNICTTVERQLRSSSSLGGRPGMGKNVTLFSYMVMQHAAHLENLSSYTGTAAVEGGISLIRYCGSYGTRGYRSTRDGQRRIAARFPVRQRYIRAGCVRTPLPCATRDRYEIEFISS